MKSDLSQICTKCKANIAIKHFLVGFSMLVQISKEKTTHFMYKLCRASENF